MHLLSQTLSHYKKHACVDSRKGKAQCFVYFLSFLELFTVSFDVTVTKHSSGSRDLLTFIEGRVTRNAYKTRLGVNLTLFVVV